MTDYIAPRQQQEMELAAFEKGRMQGEMEAARRMESEALVLHKQMPSDQLALQQQTLLQRPDVIEINRLTWAQRVAAVLGECTSLTHVILTVVWLDEWRGDIGWTNSDNQNDVDMFNTHLLCSSLGLFFLAQAITNYRISPINMVPWLNRSWYIFMQCCAVICFGLSIAANVRSNPEATFWSVADWCFAFGFAVTALHALYSMIVTLLDPLHHASINNANGDYSSWSGTGTHLETPEQMRDHSAYNHLARTVYTAAPVKISRGRNTVPEANANVGASVPEAPANAPRWAENPNTHSEDYWLLPRAKWAVVGFWAIGVAILMELAALQQIAATGPETWAQGVNSDNTPMNERGNQAKLISTLGLMVLASLAFMSYVAMPPRTAFIKNGILVDAGNRRSSISQNAETRLGNNHNLV